MRYCLGDIDRVLGLASDPLLRFQRVTLTPADGYVLSRVDGTLSAREVVAMISLPPRGDAPSLFALLSTGMIEYLPLPPKARPADASREAARRRRCRWPRFRKSSSSRLRSPPLPRRRSPRRRPPRTPPSRRTTRGAWRSWRPSPPSSTSTHFEVLGLERASTEAQVKEAYFRLARRFHPDVHHDPALADLRDKIEAIFVRLGEAYEVLRNPRIRAKYESQITPRQGGRRRSRGARGAASTPRRRRGRPPPPSSARRASSRARCTGTPSRCWSRPCCGPRASRGRKAACCWRAPT